MTVKELRPGLPECPATLGPAGRETWQSSALFLWKRGELDVDTTRLLIEYCETIDTCAETRAILDKEGFTIERHEHPARHPLVTKHERAASRAITLAGKLGLTPLSRALKDKKQRKGR